MRFVILAACLILAAPAPQPEPPRRTVVKEENCWACSGRGTLRVAQAGQVVGFVPCNYCNGTGKQTVEILPMPRKDEP
jgi:hypothetical protein